MDDFVMSNLQESRNEWCSRLVSILSSLLQEGIQSIFDEAWKICTENDEAGKYLMTFQNMLCGVPKWNAITVEREKNRIVERSGCNYLEDLISCVHIIQLKVLTCIRVGNKQKQIDISIPKLDIFIHKAYIHIARKVYMNVYLFEKNITALQKQKHNRELENIIQECILMTIRESIPTEAIIRAYMDESVEQEEEVIIENIEEPLAKSAVTEESEILPESVSSSEEETRPVVPSIKNMDEERVVTQLSFNDIDSVLDGEDKVIAHEAPKTIERLEEISNARALQRKLEEEAEEEEMEKIKIHTEPIDLSGFDVLDMDMDKPSNHIDDSNDISLLDFEELS